MASESVALGIPAIYINSLNLGYLDSHQTKGLLHIFNSVKKEEIAKRVFDILKNKEQKKQSYDCMDCIQNNSYNLTDFFLWVIMEYPDSIDKLLNNQFDPKIHLNS